jgi:hypothetical protein
MELWRSNILIDEEQLEEVSSALLSIRDAYDYSRGHFSSYYLDWDRRPEQVFNECYGNILDRVAYDLHMQKDYRFSFWMQIYPMGSLHPTHDHLSQNALYSWVHFTNPIDLRLFYWLDCEGKEYFPAQDKGDFIVFPSWLKHGVLKNTSHNLRSVIAGNVMLETKNDL